MFLRTRPGSKTERHVAARSCGVFFDGEMAVEENHVKVSNAAAKRVHSSADPVNPIRKLGLGPCSKSRVQIPFDASPWCNAAASCVSNQTKSGVACASKPCLATSSAS